jgi:hypothetical protein
MTQSTDNPGDKPDEGPVAADLRDDERPAASAERADQAQPTAPTAPTSPTAPADANASSASIAATAAATAEAAVVTAGAAAVTAATAATAAGPVLRPDPDDPRLLERDSLIYPYLALAVLCLFVVAAGLRMIKVESGSVWEPADGVMTAALGLVTAYWFIRCFTGDARRRITDIFVFAYAFTIGSFAMLVLPFVSDEEATGGVRTASLELVRGCVRSDAMGGLGGVSAVVLCPTGGVIGDPLSDRRRAEGTSEPHGGTLRYTLMLAIGGVTATVIDTPVAHTAAALAPAAAASVASVVSAASAAAGKTRRHHEVVGGLAVPFFVLVMAFIGAAVSLSRRIPEYQRRLHPSYIPTDKEGRMQPFEAREVVVFQIMQLVSAPFLAVATWFIVSPMSLTAAATLAFGTGFASEPLLLMIRGLVEGIRPGGLPAKPVLEPKPKLEPEPEPEPELELELEPKAELKPEPKSDLKPGPK